MRITRHAAVLMFDAAAITETVATPVLEMSSHASIERKRRAKK